MKEWKKADDVVYAVAEYARELCNQPIDELRLALSSDQEGRLGPARQEFVGVIKGELIEQLLLDKFCDDDDPRILVTDD